MITTVKATLSYRHITPAGTYPLHPDHTTLLRCPKTGSALTLADSVIEDGRVRSGRLVAAEGGHSYPIVDFIPRFVDASNYAGSFGFQWLKHARTQYDAVMGISESKDRLFSVTGWPERMEGETILEAGSGSGRFTEHLLATGATVMSFDYSQAVAANYASNGAHPNLLLVQANIYEMPFAHASFDRVLCLGVLQHTPDPHASFLALTKMAREGAPVVTDIYLRSLMRYWLNTRYWVRPITRRIAPQTLYPWVERYVRLMWPVARLLRKLPDRIGEALVWRLLVADYGRQFPDMADETLLEIAILDTFDMLSPAFDIPATPTQYLDWHREAGLSAVDVRPGPNGLVGSGVR